MAFNWLNPLNWLRARRHLIAAALIDTTDSKRRKWVRLQNQRTSSVAWRLERELPEDFSFVVMGDTGEGDSSQFVLVDKFLREGEDTEFTIIASDVVYPAGRSHSYREKFYVPYRHYGQDIYAIPGNHDWYDELVGFMTHFCDTPCHFDNPDRATVDREKLARLRSIRSNTVFQPNMYFYIDAPRVRIVCIDSGIRGRIDAEQLEWLRTVSATDKPKILISGAPIYVDGRYNETLSSVDAVVNEHSFHLVIAGDTHNFQKYRIPREGQQDVWHLVNGGGGAYVGRTHRIPRATNMDFSPAPVRLSLEPEEFECYPSREQSRLYYRGWFRGFLPDWLVDRDQPPYHQSFVKLLVDDDGLHVQVFVVEDFDASWVDAQPYREWLIPY